MADSTLAAMGIVPPVVVEGLAADALEALAAINALEEKAYASEEEPSDIRWEQAEKVAVSGVPERKLAAGWTNPETGEPYSKSHVHYTVEAWKKFGHLSDRPRWNTAYNSDEVRKKQRGEPKPPPPLPEGTFDVLLADPPWHYDFAETENRAIENQYDTMDVEEIAALEVPAAPNAVLYCWATAPKLREALVVIDGWGFDYTTNLVWVKDKIGMGYWARGRHELLMVATRGTPGAPAEADRPDSVIEAPRLGHSEKPNLVYDLIETAMPDRTYLELFARSGRDGWTSWGNEV